MNEHPGTSRRQWVAGVLTLLSPGLGQLYSGSWAASLSVLAVAVVTGPVLFAVFAWPSGSAWSLLVPVVVAVLGVVAVLLDAVRRARHAKLLSKRRWVRVASYVGYVVALIVVTEVESQAIQRWWAEAFRAPAASMAPTLVPGDYFMLDKRGFLMEPPARGDLAAFRVPDRPGEVYVKRVMGLPGDVISQEGGQFLVNGVPEGQVRSGTAGLGVVPANHYYLLGDARRNSRDSRFFGAVALSAFTGRPTHIYLSVDPETGDVRWDRVARLLE